MAPLDTGGSSVWISRGAKRSSPDLLRPPSSGRTYLGAKRAAAKGAAAATQAQAPRIPRREKQQQQPKTKATLDDPGSSSAQIRSFKRKPEQESIWWGEDDVLLQFCSSAQFPIWGAKRLRSGGGVVVVGGNPLNRRDWTNLGEGPAGLIAERLLANDAADYIRFRAVCRPWRLSSKDPRAHGILDTRFHPRQWVMIRETVTTLHRRRFLNVSTGHCISIDLPELHGHDVFGPTTEGLLVLLHRTTFLVRLLNPLTLQSANLPPATTLLSQIDPDEVCEIKEDFEVSGAGLADNSTFVVNFSRIKTVAVAKPGDKHWIVVDHGSCICPALSFAGRFYCVTARAIMVVETRVDQPPQLVMVAKLVRKISRMMMDTMHLVDNDGKLILVYRQCDGNGNRKYELCQVDLDARKTMPVRGLGGRAVFIGIERALSVSPSVFPTICADAIYLGFDGQFIGRMDKSPCHLMDGTAERRNVYNSINGIPLYGPWGADHYLSLCVTGYGDEAEDT